jgi:hypothetical protein
MRMNGMSSHYAGSKLADTDFPEGTQLFHSDEITGPGVTCV